MIKNRAILESIEKKKKEISCDNCKYCNLVAFHSGRWYCQHPDASLFKMPADIEECFVRR